MKKNETQFDNKANQVQNKLIKLEYIKSNPNAFTKFNSSRNAFLKNKNKTSSNFNKNFSIYNNNSKDIYNKNDKSLQIENNPFTYKKAVLVNSVQCELNFIKKTPSINIKNKINLSKTFDKKKNANIINWLNKTQIKKKKTDFSNYKFLLEQKYDFKQFFEKDFFMNQSMCSKKLNPYLKKSPKSFAISLDKYKKIFLGEDEGNIRSIKEAKENNSIFPINNLKKSFNKKNIFRKSNYTTIKIKKYQRSYNLIGLLYNLKDSTPIKKIIENKKNNKPNEQEKIFNDNYNLNLKNSFIALLNKSEIKNRNKKSYKVINEKLEPLENKLYINEKKEIYQYIQRIKNNNNLNKHFNNYKKFLEFKKLITNRRKNLEDISKSSIISNHILRNKLI